MALLPSLSSRVLAAATPFPWVGSVRVELQAEAPNFLHQETQVWTLTGNASPTYPDTTGEAAWTASGQGWSRQTTANQGTKADWIVRGQQDGQLVVQAISNGSLSLRMLAPPFQPGGLTGSSQVIDRGNPTPALRIVRDVTGWQFDPITRRTEANKTFAGSSTREVKAVIAPLQPASAKVTVTVTWSIAPNNGTAPAPLPPPTLTPQPPPDGSTGTIAPPPAMTPPTLPGSANSGVEQRLAEMERRLAELERAAAGRDAPPASPGNAPPASSGPSNPPPLDPNAPVSPSPDGRTVRPPIQRETPGFTPVPGTSVPSATPGSNPPTPPTTPPITSLPDRNRPPVIPPNPTPSAPGGTAPAPASGRYLVTMTALWCGTMTTDDPFDRDGKGDEVYGAAYIRKYDLTTLALQESTNKRTRTYGDGAGRPDRVPGGTQRSTGGVNNGDVLPNGGTAARQIPAQASVLPMKLWEGTLTNGADALVISPSIWEDDNDPAGFTGWVGKQQLTDDWLLTTKKVQDHLASRAFVPIEMDSVDMYSQLGEKPEYTAFRGYAALFGIPLGFEQAITTFRDRPIGLKYVDIANTALPNTVVVLTRESIEAALLATGSSVVTPLPGVSITLTKPALMIITFRDKTPANLGLDRAASYVMAIQVERLSP